MCWATLAGERRAREGDWITMANLLFEREYPLEQLAVACREAEAGRGSTWFICAEGGGGKSRLLSEFAAQPGRARVLWGAAEPVSPPEPYLTVLRALPAFTPAATRGASIAHAIAALEARAAGAPIVLVLDDLHYADDGTVAFLVRLASECRNRPWLVIAAFRPGEGTALLSEATVELVAQAQARRLDLAPLTLDGVSALLAEVRGGPPTEAEAATTLADSGGNPWLVEALAGGSAAMSAAHDRIQIRLGRLEHDIPGAFSVVAALAAATRAVSYEAVANLCGGDSPALRRVLRLLRDAGVFEEVDGAFRFRQELMRRSVLESMISADRRDAHRALAEVLESEGKPLWDGTSTLLVRLALPVERKRWEDSRL